MKPLLVRLLAGTVLVVVGLFLIGLGLIIAFIVGVDWLYLSLAGALLALVAGYFLFFETKRVKRSLHQSSRLYVKSRLRK